MNMDNEHTNPLENCNTNSMDHKLCNNNDAIVVVLCKYSCENFVHIETKAISTRTVFKYMQKTIFFLSYTGTSALT